MNQSKNGNKKRKGFLHLLIYLLFVNSSIFAQDIISINDLRMRHFQLKDGLSSQMVERIIQDQHGFIWLGTYNGLLRYDGHHFEKVLDGKIGAILEDNQGYIWIGTERDLIRYNPINGEQKSFFYKPKAPPKDRYDIIALAQDATGAICIGTNSDCLVRLIPSGKDSFAIHQYPCSYDKNLRRPNELKDTLAGNWLWNIVTAENGTTWLGTGSSFSEMVIPDSSQPERVQFRYMIPSYEPYLPQDYFGTAHISKGQNGKLWVVVRHDRKPEHFNFGLIFQFDPSTRQFVEYSNTQSPSIFYRYLLEDQEGNLWNGPYVNGLQLITPNDIDTIDTHHRHIKSYQRIPFVKEGDISIGGNNVQGFLQDQSGSIWVLSNYNGIYQIPPKLNAFAYYKLPLFTPDDYNNVSSVLSGDENAVWVSTWQNGLFHFNTKTGESTTFNTRDNSFPNIVSELFRDSKKQMWVLTEKRTIHFFNKAKNQFEAYPIGLSSEDIANPNRTFFLSGVSEDREGRFWMGANGMGLICFDPKQKIVLKQYLPDPEKKNWIESEGILKTICDEEGNIWAGSGYRGLYKLNKPLTDEEHFDRCLREFPMIGKLLIDRQNRFWVGTLAHGLILFDKKQLQLQERFSTDNGLGSSTIWDILEDHNGLLWLITPSGIIRFDPNTFEHKLFGKGYGFKLSQKLYNGGYINEDNQLIIGGKGGFYTLDLNTNKLDKSDKPQIVLQQLTLNNTLQTVDEEYSVLDSNLIYKRHLHLTHRQNNFSISYTGLYFDDPPNIKYQYLLENYHQDWQDVGSLREARFSNLPKGEYLLRVKAINESAHDEAKLSISIHPPWWWNNWSKLFYTLIAGLFLWTYFRFRKRLEKERQENEKISTMQRLQSRFFANISHEFRTPLTLIKGPLEDELMLTSNRDKKEKLERMHYQTQRMLGLVNELLDLSKINSGKLKIDSKPNDLHKFLIVLANSFLSYAEFKNVNYIFNIPSTPQFVFFDAIQTEKIFVNLLSNAFKHCKENGQVVFEAFYESKKEQLLFSIRNDGETIPSQELNKIFNQFYQASNASRQGSGVGLALVKELINLMEGQIEVSSTEADGTCFSGSISLVLFKENALKTFHRPTPAAVQKSFVLKDKTFHQSDSSTVSFGSEETPLILLVEDNSELRSYLIEVLKNFQILQATNGQEGWNLAVEHLPDLILSDVMMPVLDGVEMSHKLKEDSRTDHIPIILLTAKADLDSRLAGFESGIDDYLAKPFNAKELQIRVRNLIDQRTKLKQRFKQNIQSGFADLNLKSADQKFLEKALNIVNLNFSNPEFNIQTFSTEMFLSRTHLFKKLKSITGQNPTEFIRNIRLERAAELLKANSDTISQIAFSVGFNNMSYFTKCFKEKYGRTPSEFLNK